MPRIDPSQLIKCLSVLLSPSGGIKSKDEVNRIANLMTKFSKKLVSKCIYVLILKATEIDILDMFMSAGGWDLVFTWLSDGISAKNWPLVEEIVDLLLLCPVNIQRLKGNNCPKIIKALSKDVTATQKVRELACEVVEQWLAIVKGACEATSTFQLQYAATAAASTSGSAQQPSTSALEVADHRTDNVRVDDPLPVYKITIKDGKQVLAEVISDKSGSRVDSAPPAEAASVSENEQGTEDTPEASLMDVDEGPSLPSKRSTRGKKIRILDDLTESETDSSDEEIKPVSKSKRRLQAAKTSAREDVSKKRKTDEKKLKKEEKAKVKPAIVRMRAPEPPKPESRKSDSKVTKQDVKSKLEKEMLDKDRATLAKLVTPSIYSVGRIPKKSKDASGGEKKDPKPDSKEESKKDVKKEEKRLDKKPVEPPKPAPKDPKKYNYSTEIRKHDAERPKTIVKTYNSKFRSTGLEETPPSIKNLKKQDSKEEVKKSPKRSSPMKDLPVPEKKSRSHDDKKSSADKGREDEKKVTSPKPKTLQESDMFADALTAANSFKDQKRRKRRSSTSGNSPLISSKDSKEISPPKKLLSIKEESDDDRLVDQKEDVKPEFKFYQETLITSDDLEREKSAEETTIKKEVVQMNDEDSSGSPVDNEEIENEITKTEEAISKQLKLEEKKNEEREKNRLVSGILVYVKKRKTMKKCVQWRPQHQLIETKFFELDEAERVNVTKTFMDMKQIERSNEREQLMLSRKIAANDIMEEKMMWRHLIPIDLPGDMVESGKNSLEKDIQFQRERTIVPAIYFNKKLIPDSPGEPDLEIHATTEPVIIPLLDQTGNSESVISYKAQGWPDPVETPPETIYPVMEQHPPMDMPPPSMMQTIPPLMDFVRPPGPPGFFPPQMGPPQMGPPQPGPMPPPVTMMPPPPMWINDGSAMMGPTDQQMMMGPPPGVMPPDMSGQFPMGPPPGPMNPGQFMGGPPPPPQGFPQQPPMQNMHDGPPPRNNRPWYNNNNQSGPGGGGQWRKGGGGGGGGWDRSKKNRTCLNIIKRGYCKTPHCSFKHPPPYKPA